MRTLAHSGGGVKVYPWMSAIHKMEWVQQNCHVWACGPLQQRPWEPNKPSTTIDGCFRLSQWKFRATLAHPPAAGGASEGGGRHAGGPPHALRPAAVGLGPDTEPHPPGDGAGRWRGGGRHRSAAEGATQTQAGVLACAIADGLLEAWRSDEVGAFRFVNTVYLIFYMTGAPT